MSKMTKPTVGVVRFTEGDVIVASGFMSVTGLGNRGGEEGHKGDGEWMFGSSGSHTSSDIDGNKDYYVELLNDYLGTDYLNLYDFYVNPWESLGSLVAHDMEDVAGSSYNDSDYNGTYRWDGIAFVKQ